LSKENLYAIIDVETTGGDPRRDRITEIAVFVFDGKEVVKEYVTLVNPEVPIPYHITRITGITNEMVENAPRFFEVAKELVEVTEGAIFVAHNVRFDYSFFQKEFRELGYTYTRPQLCTVRLSRRIIPGLPSYSLKNLCSHLRIQNEASHRAWGDAAATVELFKLLIRSDEKEHLAKAIKQELKEVRLPPNLPPSVMDELPEETGIYYFLDEAGEILYIGKSTNIRARVMSHFRNADKQVRFMQMARRIHKIDFRLTGSELLALLEENEEIKQFQPPFNKAQRQKGFKYGILSYTEQRGYTRLKVVQLRKGVRPVAVYPEKGNAEAVLVRLTERYGLCRKLVGLENGRGACFSRQLHVCKGACMGEEHPGEYNERVASALANLNYGIPDFLVIEDGRHRDERVVVSVQQGVYRGFAFVEPDFLQNDIETIREVIEKKEESPDVQKIIKRFVQRHPQRVRPG
jgi:DNA polymerase-3 subunit epsilon